VVLAAAALGKLVRPAAARAGLAALAGERPALPLLLVLVPLEAAGAVLLVAGPARPGALIAAAIGAGGAVLGARAALQGAGAVPCGCFGERRTRSARVLAARGLLLALAGVVAAAPAAPSRTVLAAAAFAGLLLMIVLLVLLVAALARELARLRGQLAPGSPLELDGEGPALRSAAPPLQGLAGRGPELVVFGSSSCRLCRELDPALRELAARGLRLRLVDEAQEPETFGGWNIPGTPFAVHLVDGIVAAKGLVNTERQLDALIGTGEARAAAHA
jgi:hypothetical protein